jgi:hypothetical protein
MEYRLCEGAQTRRPLPAWDTAILWGSKVPSSASGCPAQVWRAMGFQESLRASSALERVEGRYAPVSRKVSQRLARTATAATSDACPPSISCGRPRLRTGGQDHIQL